MGKLENFVTRHTVNVKQMRNQFQLKSSFDASAPYYKKASSTRSRTGKRTAAEDSSAKSYSTAYIAYVRDFSGEIIAEMW